MRVIVLNVRLAGGAISMTPPSMQQAPQLLNRVRPEEPIRRSAEHAEAGLSVRMITRCRRRR